MTDREPVGQTLNSMLTTLDDIAGMALNENYDEVAAEQIRLGQIISRAQLILAFIESKHLIQHKVWNRRRRVI
jgi:hypothetical protein